MSPIFKFGDYKIFLRAHIAGLPKSGRGIISRIAEHLGVNQSLISQILTGAKHLTPEQAVELADFLGFSESETDYFCLLVQRERAGTHKLKKFTQIKIDRLRKESRQLRKGVGKGLAIDHEMSEEAKAVYYSSWIYSAVRMLTSLEEYHTSDAIAAKLHLSLGKVTEVLRFLVRHGLCLEKNGRFDVGPQRTHLDRGSPLVTKHHMNWRMRAMQKSDSLRDDDLMYTLPFTMSRKEVEEIRDQFRQSIQSIVDRIGTTASESFYCLNIDLFEV